MSSPPPLFLTSIGSAATFMDANSNPHSHSSSLDSLKPSVIIIILILFVTLFISLSLCLLLRHLNRCPQPHLFSSSFADSRIYSSRRVSPEIASFSLLDSLPLFTFSSVTRRCSSASSAMSGDCAVCLSKFEPHDQLRLLPLCCHAFHAECIDTWLLSNQTCPLCRSPLFSSETDLMKALLASSSSAAIGAADTTGGGGGGSGGVGENSFRLEIGSISRRQAAPESGDQRISYSIGSLEYVVDGESEVRMSNAHRRSTSGKEEEEGVGVESRLAAEVGGGSRNWLKDYVDRVSRSVSSRALSFRSSGRFFTGSSRRMSEVSGGVEVDLEANGVGEEISELFRWISGV